MRLHNSGTWRHSAYVPYRKWRTRNHGSRAPRPTHIPMTVIWILRIQCIIPNHGYQSMIMTLSRQSLQSVRLKLLFFYMSQRHSYRVTILFITTKVYIRFIVWRSLLLGHFGGAFPGSHDGLEISLAFCTSRSPPQLLPSSQPFPINSTAPRRRALECKKRTSSKCSSNLNEHFKQLLTCDKEINCCLCVTFHYHFWG